MQARIVVVESVKEGADSSIKTWQAKTNVNCQIMKILIRGKGGGLYFFNYPIILKLQFPSLIFLHAPKNGEREGNVLHDNSIFLC